MNYYERHIGDYIKDTSHLSLLEHGVYTRLLDVYYTRESPIHAKDAARLVGARSKDELEALESVLSEFFTLDADAGVYRQDRCDREIARFGDKQRKAKASADARWSAHRTQSEGNANASPNAMRTHSEGNAPRARPQTPDTRHQKEKPPKPPAQPSASLLRFPPGFEELWSVYPRKIGKDAAARAYAKRKPDKALAEAMVAAVRQQRDSADWRKDGGQFIPHLSTWLNAGRWQDEADRSQSSVDEVFGAAL